jgi:hypothetical protein
VEMRSRREAPAILCVLVAAAVPVSLVLMPVGFVCEEHRLLRGAPKPEKITSVIKYVL